ncbi:GNAT family N-acetyltransferase [Catellatospora paridis]|uniref:GNAT family N-acetyltransferase n=1 Tax=Catellatospora paridis TaxID=1617086 RepID=UPI0012D470B8|nr:GNAT family N-acetyltransferase [Catellatospora paridis]
MFEMGLAFPADLDAIFDLYREAQAWLKSKGLGQWQPAGVSQVQHLEQVRGRIERAILAGTCYVARLNNQVVGTLTLDEFADPEFWAPEDRPEEALYVHRMIVSRQAAGGDVGKALLDWAAAEAARQGKRWLRLDAWQTNHALHSYYERQGFRHVRTMNYGHRGSGALFEREVGEVSSYRS